MEELQLDNISVSLGKIDYTQIDKISEYANRVKKQFDGLTLTDDNLDELKEVHANLNKLYTSLENERKRIKNIWATPYIEWENKLKDAIQPILDCKSSINSQLVIYQDNKRIAHENNINKWFEKEAKSMAPGLYEFVEANKAVKNKVLKKEHYNITYAPTKRENEVRQALRDVLVALDNIGDDKELLSLYAELGSYIDAIAERKSRRDRMERLNRIAPSNKSTTTISQPDRAMHTISFDLPIKVSDDDLKPAALIRRFKGPKYRLLALLEIAKKLELEVIKVDNK